MHHCHHKYSGIYQDLQEIRRVQSEPAALVMSDVPEIHIRDALDLRNFKFAIVDADGTPIRSKVPAIAERCIMENLGEERWDCLVATDRETGYTAVIRSRAMGTNVLKERKLKAARWRYALWRRAKAALSWGQA